MAIEGPKLQQTNTFIGGMDTDTPDMLLNGTTYREAVNMRLGVDESGVGVLTPIPQLELSTSIFVDVAQRKNVRLLQTFKFRQKAIHILLSQDGDYWYIVSYDNDSKKFSRISKISQSDWDVTSKISATFSYESENNQKIYLANGSQPILIIPIDKQSSGDDFVFGPDDINKLRSYPSALLKPVKIVGPIAGNLIYGRVQYSYRLYNKFLSSSEAAIPTRQFPVIYNQGSSANTRGGGVGENSNMGVGLEISIDNTDFEYIQIFRIQYTNPNQKPAVYTIYDGKINAINGKVSFSDSVQQAIDQMSIEEFNTLSGIHIIPEAVDNKEDRLFAANIKEASTNIVDQIVKDYDTRAFRFHKDSNVWKSELYQFGGDQYTEITIGSNTDGFINQSEIISGQIPDEQYDCYNKYNDFNDRFVYGPDTSNYDKYNLSGEYGGSGVNIQYKLVVGNVVGDSNEVYSGNYSELSGAIPFRNSDADYDHLSSVLSTDNDVAFNINSGVNVSTIDYDCNTFNEGDNEEQIKTYSSDLFANTNGLSYKNPIVSSSFPSLRRDEIYRYGIVFYDVHGNKSSVKWIADIRTPQIRESGNLQKWVNPSQATSTHRVKCNRIIPFTQNCNTAGEHDTQGDKQFELVTHPMGIQFKIRNLPDEIVAYEIVRANRQITDVHNTSQGILFNVGINQIDDPDNNRYQKQFFRYSQGIPSITEFWSQYIADTPTGFQKSDLFGQLYQFASPEVCYYNNFDITGKLRPIYQVFSQSMAPTKKVYNSEKGIYFSRIYPAECGLTLKYWNPATLPQDWEQEKETWLGATRFRLLTDFWGDWEDNNSDHTVSRSLYAIKREPQSNVKKYGYAVPLKISTEDFQDHYYDKYHKIVGSFSDVSWTDSDPKLARELVKNSYAYLKNYNVSDGTNGSKLVYITANATELALGKTFDILESKHLDNSLQTWNSLSDNSGGSDATLKYEDNVVAIGNYAFVNYFVSGAVFDLASNPIAQFANETFNLNKLVGPGGTGALLLLNGTVFAGFSENFDIYDVRTHVDAKFGPVLCNIQQDIQPYGGGSNTAIKTTSYNSYCNYYTVDRQGSQQEQECVVFDGDTYILPFEYISLHKWYDPYEYVGRRKSYKHMIVSTTPVETSIDFVYSHGNEFSRNASNIATNIQEKPANVNNIYIQSDSLYKYNGTYNDANVAQPYVAYDESQIDVQPNLDCRIYASEIKASNEYIDNWIRFKPANYIDVDSKYGPITNIRKFRDRLIYWQSNATGIASVNERQVLTSDSDAQLVIGSSGILERYDYISLQYGMESKSFNDTQSDNALYWINAKLGAILAFNESVENIARTKKIQNYINNSGDSISTQCYYDEQHKEVMFCGLNTNGYIEDLDPNDTLELANHGGTIVYSEDVQAFSHVVSSPFEDLSSVIKSFCFNLIWIDSIHNLYAFSRSATQFYNYQSVIFTVNQNTSQTKTFDTIELGINYNKKPVTEDLPPDDDYTAAIFMTPLGQRSIYQDNWHENREVNNRIAIPRDGTYDDENVRFGNRMRGKTMSILLAPPSGASLSYVTTKFRMSLA